MELIIENVRSFCGRHSIPIKPLTLLVGENSTGKSTFLAMLAHVSQAGFPSFRPSFNTPPFDLGTYDSIATFRGGRYGRSGSFSIGFIRDGGPAEEKVLATYTNSLGQPQLSELVAVWKENELRFESDGPASYSGKATWTRKGELQKPVPVNFKNWELGAMEVPLVVALQFHCLQTLSPKGFPGAITAPQKVFLPASALAPVRTKPRRTYDEISDEFKPEGDHIPVLLAHMWQQEGGLPRQHLFEALSEFGTKSSLFRKVGVRRLGKSPSDPFQIVVTTAGPPVNLPDVGYGVSQALPVIIQSVLASEHRMLLLQQPEVHLHPRGQAALGSFFCRLVAREHKHFVIETHSDYLLDRVRIEVGQGTVPPENVLILFFDKKGLATQIHPINLDKLGNVIGAPDSYRRFFLDEEINLVTRSGS